MERTRKWIRNLEKNMEKDKLKPKDIEEEFENDQIKDILSQLETWDGYELTKKRK